MAIAGVEGDEFINEHDARQWIHDGTKWIPRPFRDHTVGHHTGEQNATKHFELSNAWHVHTEMQLAVDKAESFTRLLVTGSFELEIDAGGYHMWVTAHVDGGSPTDADIGGGVWFNDFRSMVVPFSVLTPAVAAGTRLVKPWLRSNGWFKIKEDYSYSMTVREVAI